MEARAKILGHPIHQMIVVLPLGMLSGAVLFDIIHLASGGTRWAEMAYWLMLVGIITALIAAVFGLIDYLAIPRGTRAKRIGLVHGVGNVLVVLLFIASWLLRRDDPMHPRAMEMIPSFLGFVLAGITGWLGGELVDRLGIGVHDHAHVDAPSSLSHRPASDHATA